MPPRSLPKFRAKLSTMASTGLLSIFTTSPRRHANLLPQPLLILDFVTYATWCNVIRTQFFVLCHGAIVLQAAIMGDAGFYRGTSCDQDSRFTDKERKLLKQMRFEVHLRKR